MSAGGGRCSSSCSCRASGQHPNKEFLKAWYGRIGYRVIRTGRMDRAYPHLAPLLATPCDLLGYEKPLHRGTLLTAVSREGRCGGRSRPGHGC